MSADKLLTIKEANKWVTRHIRKNVTSPDILSQKHTPLVESLTGIVSKEEAEKWASEDSRIKYLTTKEI